MSEVAVVSHLIMPGYIKDQVPILLDQEESIADFLTRSEWEFKLPTICVINGSPVLRKDWATTTITHSAEVLFYSRPYGSGASGAKTRTILSLVALVALAAFAPWAAGAAGFATGTFGFYATVSAITLAGGFLVSTFLAPKPAANDSETINQIYSLTASGNTANPFQTIPVQYGRLKQNPPYAAIPWSDFVGNDAYLNVLLANGQGKYEVEQILVDDTVMWDHISGLSGNFTDVEIQLCPPGTPFTLFPSNVAVASEFNGQEITNVPLGYFIINPSGTKIYRTFIDFVLPAGARYTDSKGRTRTTDIHLWAYLQEVDDAGTPIGPEVAYMNNYTLTYNTPQPTRFTFDTGDIPEGRYQVKIYRNPTTFVDTDTSGSAHDVITDLIQVVSVRGYVKGSTTFTNSSVIGIRMRATAQLSQNSAKRFGVIQTRILPVWDGTEFVETTTKNPWWAFYDAATNSHYGALWPINKIDFQTIVQQAANADSRGDSFNYRFDSAVTFQQAFDTILASSRAKTSWLGDVLSAVRDEWKSIPQMLISDAQIIRGSLEVDYILNSEDNSDCVQGQFLNENTWQPAQLQYPPQSDSFNAQAPAQLQLDGVTNPDQFYRELRFLYKQSQLRRIKARLDTEHDGRLLRFGSVIKLQSHLPKKWGVAGEIKSYNSGTRILSLNKTVVADILGADMYVELRSKVGGYFGPVLCTVNGDPTKITLDATDLASVEAGVGITISDALDRMDGAEPPSFVFGKASELSRNCIVLSGAPNQHKVSLEMVVDNINVHDDSAPDVPVIPVPPVYVDPRVPLISGLTATILQSVAQPTLTASWFPAKGALFYKAQISYDSGANWTTLRDDLTAPNLTEVVSYANLRLRVAGIGQIQGPYSSVDVEAPTLTNPFPVGPSDLQPSLKDYVMNQLKASADNFSKVVQQIASIASEHDAANATQTQELKSVSGLLKAAVSVLQTAFTDSEIAFAEYQVTVTASFNDLNATVTETSSALATTTGILDAKWGVSLDVNGNISGIENTNDGTTSNFRVLASNFVVASPSVNGGATKDVFKVGTVGGVAAIVWTGNMYGDGDITAQSLHVTTLASISADIGSVTAGTMQDPAGKMLVDLNNTRIVISQ